MAAKKAFWAMSMSLSHNCDAWLTQILDISGHDEGHRLAISISALHTVAKLNLLSIKNVIIHDTIPTWWVSILPPKLNTKIGILFLKLWTKSWVLPQCVAPRCGFQFHLVLSPTAHIFEFYWPVTSWHLLLLRNGSQTFALHFVVGQLLQTRC